MTTHLFANEKRMPVSLEFIIFSQPQTNTPFHSNMDLSKYYAYLPDKSRDNYQFPTSEIDHLAENIDLDESHTLMDGVLRQLRRHNYQFIHKRWAILLDDADKNSWVIDTTIPVSAGKGDTDNPIEQYHLRGKVALEYKHYYDLTTDITIEPIHRNGQIDVIDHQSEYRRLKAKHLHYIDHPRIGILAKITPLPDLYLNSSTPLTKP